MTLEETLKKIINFQDQNNYNLQRSHPTAAVLIWRVCPPPIPPVQVSIEALACDVFALAVCRLTDGC